MRRILRNDVSKTFFKEFSEKINFCGIYLRAIITEINSEGKFDWKSSLEHDSQLIVHKGKKVSIKSRSLPIRIEVGDTVTINSEKYSVNKLYEKDNISHIYVEKYED